MHNPLAAKAVIRIKRMHPAIKSVCEFGNQRLDRTLQDTGIDTTKHWYASKEILDYTALDVNEKMGAVITDLNYEVDVDGLGQFDLVTNNGTGEHLFNQAMVFKNAHDLCKVGRIMLHIMPFTPWFNHGFFNYNPILFRDIAAANKYGWLFFWITDRVRDPVDLPTEYRGWPFIEKRPHKLLMYVTKGQWNTDIYLVVAWQKMSLNEFKLPLQGKYLKDVDDDGLEKTYGVSHV